MSALKKDLTKRILIGVVFGLFAAFALSYGSIIKLFKSTVQPAELPQVNYVNFKVYDPIYVGIDKGFFEDQGIQVNIVGDVLAGPTAIQAVASGQAEAGLSSIPAIINANAAGLPITGITDIQSALDNQALEYYFTKCGSGIETVEDLKGKNIAVNLWYSSFHYTIIMALEQIGLSEKDANYTLISFANQMPSLISGDVDVIGLMEPYASQAKAVLGSELCEVFNANDVFGSKQFSLIFVNRIWAENNPETAAAFAKGIQTSINWIEENQAEAKLIISKYTDIEAEFVPEYHFQKNGMVVMEDVRFWYDYLNKSQEKPFWFTPDDVATNKYLGQ